jgi:tRNA (guanine37-N1)-methyltransferase
MTEASADQRVGVAAEANCSQAPAARRRAATAPGDAGLRIDVVTIFPDYLAPARLSLLGRARDAGLVALNTHDLRDWTHDRHRTVDDTPYGGGAGMVMSPEPWGEALDAILGEAGGGGAVLVVPTASGAVFDQGSAERLAQAGHLVFACGRYEGIDARVAEHYRARAGVAVEEFSIGDYVLAGGEAAALVMIEAITRLLPGVLGNAESLVEESHAEAGLLEYPAYTRPPEWRGLVVPDVLLSGNHGQIAAWRRDRALERTRRMRPDLRR